MAARYVTELVGALERYGERPAIGAGPRARSPEVPLTRPPDLVRA
ncbi:hypothetical protein [Streptomyces sp. NPDC089915]